MPKGYFKSSGNASTQYKIRPTKVLSKIEILKKRCTMALSPKKIKVIISNAATEARNINLNFLLDLNNRIAISKGEKCYEIIG